ncbi:hypothetical protein G6F56_006598 [Rhizopus delemar]|nr:hypothetical protein G6F56_006598 [Rhizopus delemar]
MCPNGCYLFDPVTDAGVVKCPEYSKPRSGKQLKMVSIGQKLAHLWPNKEVREAMKYRYSNSTSTGTDNSETVYNDIHDGKTYKEQKNGHLKNKFDIGVVINVGGFTSNVSSESMHIIKCIIMNFDPSIRYS